MRYASIVAFLLMACAPISPYLQNKHGKTPAARNMHQCYLPVFYAMDETVPKEKYEAIHSAFQYWNDATGMELFFPLGVMPSEEDSDVIMMVSVDQEEVLAVHQYAILDYEHYDNGCFKNSDVLVNPIALTRDIGTFETIMRHEAGHGLGLAHSDIFTDLMYGVVQKTVQHPVDASEREIRNVINLYTGDKNGKKR